MVKDVLGTGKYYDFLQILYDIFYSRGTSGLHYGFWDKDTKTIKDSILNTNKFVMDNLGIDKGDIILDAGCGVGGNQYLYWK